MTARQSAWEEFGSDPPAAETRVVHRSEDYDIYIGRGDGGDAHLVNTPIGETGWLGNPYKTQPQGEYTREQSIALYCREVLHQVDHNPEFVSALARLKGQRLACYCRRARETEPVCHGDVLVAVIDGLRLTDSSGEADGGDRQ